MAKAKGKGGAAAVGNGHEHDKFAPGDVVLGKIKGYPPWPGILVDEENVPKQNVLSQRPGKTFLIVRFFPAADYGFNKPHELRRLSKREIEAFLADPHKRNADLRQAYQLAQDPEEWNKEQNDAVKQAEEEGEEEQEEEDMLAEEDVAEEQEESVAKKKRKAPAAKPAAKKQKTEAAASKPQKKAPANSSANAAKKSEGADEHEGEEQELDPETKKVKSWRHALQRAYLNKEQVIKADEMEQHDRILKQVEEYTGITANQLRLTKIGKVMKRIIQLPDIPREGEFKIKERAQKLCDAWSDIVAGKSREESGQNAPSAPHANGNGNGHASVEKASASAATASTPAASAATDSNTGAAKAESEVTPAPAAATSTSSTSLAAQPAEQEASAPAPVGAQEPAPTPSETKTDDLSKPAPMPVAPEALQAPSTTPSADTTAAAAASADQGAPQSGEQQQQPFAAAVAPSAPFAST